MTKQHPRPTSHRNRHPKQRTRGAAPSSSPAAPASPPPASPPPSSPSPPSATRAPSQQLALIAAGDAAGNGGRRASRRVPGRVPGQAIVLSNLAERAEQAASFAAASRAKRTRETYQARWRLFAEWCSGHGLCPLPCTPQVLSLFVVDETERGVSPRSTAVMIAAIGYAHTRAGIERARHPHRDSHFAELFRGIKREKGRPPRRVAPLVIGELRQVAERLPATRLIDVRNRALLAVGFSGALRRSELVELDVSDVEFVAEGLKVTIRRSKTDQESHGTTIALPPNRTAAVDPVGTLKAWLKASGIEGSGPLFRSMNRHGQLRGRMAGRDVARVIQQSVKAAGLDPSKYSGHSLRAGLATSAAAAGKSDRSLVQHGRWRGSAMLQVYVRNANLFVDNAADGL